MSLKGDQLELFLSVDHIYFFKVNTKYIAIREFFHKKYFY